jgi:hypothetical protein
VPQHVQVDQRQAAGESIEAGRHQAGQPLVLEGRPGFEAHHDPSAPGHRSGAIQMSAPLPMLPFRVVAIVGVALGFVFFGWQVSRVIDEQPRLASLAWGSAIAGAIGALGVLLWTYVVVENARRAMDPATTQELPRPGYAVTTWIVPLVFAVGSTASVVYLSRRLNTPIEGTESSFPLVLAVVAIIAILPLMYSPVTCLTSVVRKIGGHGIKLGEWVLVPATLAIVGAAMTFGLRAGGAFGDEVDGLAPTWFVAIAAIVPATVVVFLGSRAAAIVEADVRRAFDRRHGVHSAPIKPRRKFLTMSIDEGPNVAAQLDRGVLRQLPGGNIVGVAITAGLAGLALLSVVGALVMYLFWQEARDGVLLSTQSERAWDVLAMLHSAERLVAYAVVVAATVWTAIAVTNVRLASARRRNPLLASVMWPIAGFGVWAIADRWIVDGTVVEVVVGFAAQAALLFVPFSFLERSADAVNARRNPFRLAYAFGVVLLVYVQGLGGLSTLSSSAEPREFGRLAGYLAVGALIQLVAMFAVSDATRSLIDGSATIANQHNRLISQRATGPARPAASYANAHAEV